MSAAAAIAAAAVATAAAAGTVCSRAGIHQRSRAESVRCVRLSHSHLTSFVRFTKRLF